MQRENFDYWSNLTKICLKKINEWINKLIEIVPCWELNRSAAARKSSHQSRENLTWVWCFDSRLSSDELNQATDASCSAPAPFYSPTRRILAAEGGWDRQPGGEGGWVGDQTTFPPFFCIHKLFLQTTKTCPSRFSSRDSFWAINYLIWLNLIALGKFLMLPKWPKFTSP